MKRDAYEIIQEMKRRADEMRTAISVLTGSLNELTEQINEISTDIVKYLTELPSPEEAKSLVESMSDKDKSITLCYMMGWGMSYDFNVGHVKILNDEGSIVYGPLDFVDVDGRNLLGSLYEREMLGLSWVVLNWATHNDTIGEKVSVWWSFFNYEPSQTQRAILDKVLELGFLYGLAEE